MKLIVANGPKQGEELEIPAPGVSIGREQDNDLVLDDAQSSRYHAKVEQDGNVWVVKDNNSSNGVRLNGRRIQESAPLDDKDEITIGETTLVFAQDDAGPGAGAEGQRQTGGAKKTDGDDEETSADDGRKKRLRLLAVAFITLLAVVVVAVALQSRTAPESNGQTPVNVGDDDDDTIVIPAKPLRVIYEREIAGRRSQEEPYDVYLYRLEIENRQVTVRKRDLSDQLRQDETFEISAEEEAELRQQILGRPGFIGAQSRRRRERELIDRLRLTAAAGALGNHVVYLNETGRVPKAVEDATEALDALCREHVHINHLPRDEAFAIAERLYIKGKQLYAEREVHPENLYNAWKYLDNCVRSLEGYDNPPEFYAMARKERNRVKRVFDEKIEQLLNEARHLEHTDEQKAILVYEEIRDCIPDETHEAAIEAKEKIIDLRR